MQQLLDNSNKGAVLVSFGSIADTRKMSPQMRKAMFQAFAKFPEYTFLWKFHKNFTMEEEADFKTARNVHLFEWVDQNAVLSEFNLYLNLRVNSTIFRAPKTACLHHALWPE